MELIESLYPFLYGYVFLVVGFYHLIISVVFRAKIFTYYVIITVGLGIHYLLPYPLANNPEIQDPSVLTALCVLTGSLLFTSTFLNVKEYSNSLTKIYRILILVVIFTFTIQAVNILILDSSYLTTILSIIAASLALSGTLFQLFSGFFLLKKEKSARIYLITMLPMLLAAIIYVVVWYLKDGFDIPWWMGQLIANLMVIQMVLFGVILALRFRTTQAEKFAYQKEMNDKLEKEVEQQTRELKVNNKKLKEANNLKQRLISLITHDVRSPLQQLNSLLYLMGDSENSIKQSEALINATQKNISSLSSSMENLLQWSNSQLGGLEAKKEQINLRAFLDSFVDEFSTLLQAKNQTLIQNETDIEITFDPNMLMIVLRNLIHNAIKFSSEGEAITIIAQQSSDDVKIKIIDNGIGMKPEWFNNNNGLDKNSIQLGTNNEKGSGFGLTIVKDLTKLNGGEIRCFSTSKGGTTFEIELSSKVGVVV